MKKNWFCLLLLMAVAVMPLTSCDKEDIPQPEEILKHDPESDADQSTVEAYDALEWLQGCIVLVDNKNEIIRRINGKPLDESQPTVISVPVADYIAAEETFLDWVAPDKEATKVEGGYDYNLTDAFDNELQVYLSNTFTSSLLSQFGRNPHTVIYDLYLHAFDKTNGSHVMVYNPDCYGNLYLNDMSEYYPND